MTVPTKFIFRGDQLKGRALVGTGHRAMALLENLMSFQGLEQYNIQVTPYPGALIKCSKVFGLRTVEILTGGGPAPAPPGRRRLCLCGAYLTHGYVFEVPEVEGSPQVYSVIVCTGRRSYTKFDDVLASDFTKYEVDQKIILVAYNGVAALSTPVIPGTKGCSPKISEVLREDLVWRTTYRILPWCGDKLKQWVHKDG